MLLNILQIISLFGGLSLLYSAFFMYEDEEGVVQDLLAQLWLTLADKNVLVSTKLQFFLENVSAICENTFNRIFGKKKFSLELVSSIICLSVGLLLLLTGVSSFYGINDNNNSLVINFLVILFFIMLGYKTVDVTIKQEKIIWKVYLLAGLILTLLFTLSFFLGKNKFIPIGILLGLLIDILVVYLSYLLIRKIRISKAKLWIKLGLILTFSASVILIAAILPMKLGRASTVIPGEGSSDAIA